MRVLADRSECDRFASYAGRGLQRYSVRPPRLCAPVSSGRPNVMPKSSAPVSGEVVPHMPASPPRALPGGHRSASNGSASVSDGLSAVLQRAMVVPPVRQ